MPGKRPNILFIQADQMAAPALPFHGRPVVKAPKMAALKAQALESQRRRRLCLAATSQGRVTPWDTLSVFDASRQYARNSTAVLGDRERRARLPYGAEPPPDGSPD